MIKRRTFIELTCLAACTLTYAAAKADTLATMRQSGTLRVAVLNDYAPFGSVGPDMQLVGLDIDLVKALGPKLGVKMELVPTTGSAQNIPLLQTGKVDLIVADLGETAERAKVIAFSAPYALTYNAVYGPADLSEAKPADLTGRSVSVPRGGTEDIELSKIAPSSTTIMRFEDDTTTLAAYSSGQVDNFVTGNSTAAVFAKLSPRPFVLKFRFDDEPAHMAVRKDDQAFLAKLNQVIGELRSDGTLSALSTKWLGSPLPSDFK